MILRPMRKLLIRLTACLLLALLVLAGTPSRAAVLTETCVGDFFSEPLTPRLTENFGD